MVVTWLPGVRPDLARRSEELELLDGPDLDCERLRLSLGHVADANRWLGGLRSVQRHLLPLARRGAAAGKRELSLLDVGVGNADAPRRLARRILRSGVRLHWIGLDLSAKTLDVARQGGGEEGREHLVRGDALELPFGNRSFDVAVAILTLHHFSGGDELRVLAEMARVARHAVIVSDLERHPLNYLGARALAATRWRRDSITRHDAPLSVRRSFTSAGLLDLGRRAPFDSVTVNRYFPFRLVLEGRPVLDVPP